MVLVRINTTTGVAVVNLDDVSSILAIPEGSQINFKSQNPPLLKRRQRRIVKQAKAHKRKKVKVKVRSTPKVHKPIIIPKPVDNRRRCKHPGCSCVLNSYNKTYTSWQQIVLWG
jgi:hypothetical protein